MNRIQLTQRQQLQKMGLLQYLLRTHVKEDIQGGINQALKSTVHRPQVNPHPFQAAKANHRPRHTVKVCFYNSKPSSTNQPTTVKL